MPETIKTVSVQHRGDFDHDSFFRDSWGEWDRAMRDAVRRWDSITGRSTRNVDQYKPYQAKNVYRDIRSSNISFDESQAVSCTEEEDRFKMVIDVKDFKPEDISVKVVDDTIVVEGKIEKRDDCSVTSNKFTRRFLLPANVDMSCVSSALSKDGVLSVHAPKQIVQRGERVIPTLRNDDTVTGKLMGPMPRSSVTKSYTPKPAAGRPSISDGDAFNPTGGGNVSVFETPKKDRYAHMVDGNTSSGVVESDRKMSASRPSYGGTYGKPTQTDEGFFNPTGGSNVTIYGPQKKDTYAHMADGGGSVGVVDSDRKGSINSVPYGKRTISDNEPFNPTGGSNVSVYGPQKKDMFSHMVDGGSAGAVVDSDRSRTNWSAFNDAERTAK